MQTEVSSDETVSAALSGDGDAFGAMWKGWEGYLLTVARRVLGDATEARDVVQDAAVLVWTSRDTIRDRRPVVVRGYAVSVVEHRAMDAKRARARRPAVDVLPEDVDTRRHGDAGPAVVAAVAAMLASLTPIRREVVELHYLRGLTCREVAEETGRSVEAVKVALNRARADLRDSDAAGWPVSVGGAR